jgi:hypothetical protein
MTQSNTGLSPDDIAALNAAPTMKPGLSDDELAALNAAPPVRQGSSLGDLAKSAGAGLVRGGASALGFPEDLAHALAAGAGYVDEKVPFLHNLDAAVGFNPTGQKDREIAALQDKNGWGSAYFDDLLTRSGIATYKPQSSAGEHTYDVAHFVGGALPMGLGGVGKELVKTGLGGATKALAGDAIVGLGGGLGTEAARTGADALGVENPVGRLAIEGAGALAGGLGGAAGANRFCFRNLT